ncbi:unnamed protein product [Aureobasidium uvarum]|uniref:Transcription factor domain-containing protein n=1 Tax=Aureobasidium uvarum TaxID=2773716 RepID=A0A9N8PTK8_9PEZI|nr:unnamed protein product [Aureobasidium uvarum]
MSGSPRPNNRVRKTKGKGLRTRTGWCVAQSDFSIANRATPVTLTQNSGANNEPDPSTLPQAEPLTAREPSSQEADDYEITLSENVATTDIDETPLIYYDEHNVNQNIQLSANDNFSLPALEPAALNTTSPASTASGNLYSAEVAPWRWLDLLRRDATVSDDYQSGGCYLGPEHDNNAHQQVATGQMGFDCATIPEVYMRQGDAYNIKGQLELSGSERILLRHFVDNISSWFDLTDRDASFTTSVPAMALHNRGLMLAILALSSRHQSLLTGPETSSRIDRTVAVQYYNETLQYLQIAMKMPEYLKSEELLATVLLISTYEMIDGLGSGWERHLKGVFWIQRSQLIHGESGGLRQAIWWAWLRQDIWAAFRGGRVILSFYTLKKDCAELDRWELINRVVWLLGQCISFGSDAEVEAGRTNVQQRIHRAAFLTSRLDEWSIYFAIHRKELPADCVAVQIYYFARIMLAVHSPAVSGLKELERQRQTLDNAIDQIGGIACTTSDTSATIISTQCLFAAGLNLRDSVKREHIVRLLRSHQARTGWPVTDLAEDLQAEWAMDASPVQARS